MNLQIIRSRCLFACATKLVVKQRPSIVLTSGVEEQVYK